jgi:hypothetical protein
MSPSSLVVALLFSGSALAGPPSGLEARLADFNAHAHFPLPAVDPVDVERLEEGGLVKIREVPADPELPQRVVGLLLTDQPRDALWISFRDKDFEGSADLTEVRVTPFGARPELWYGHLDAPRPFADRHWLIDTMDTWELARGSDDRCWEHWWAVRPDGLPRSRQLVADGQVPHLSVEDLDSAIYTPVNHGAWLACALDDGRTLLGYHVTFVAGGKVPDRLIADWGLATLGRLLRRVEERAAAVNEHYTVGHEPIAGGDGVAVPLR